MGQKLPRELVIALLSLGCLSLLGAFLLETWELGFLQNHPVLVNLLSSVIGFSFGLLTVAVIFNWIIRWNQVAAEARRILRMFPSLPLSDSRDEFGPILGRLSMPRRVDLSTLLDQIELLIAEVYGLRRISGQLVLSPTEVEQAMSSIRELRTELALASGWTRRRQFIDPQSDRGMALSNTLKELRDLIQYKIVLGRKELRRLTDAKSVVGQ